MLCRFDRWRAAERILSQEREFEVGPISQNQSGAVSAWPRTSSRYHCPTPACLCSVMSRDLRGADNCL